MRKTFLLILVFLLILPFFFINKNNSSAEDFYHLNSIFFSSYTIQQNFKNNVDKLFINDTIYCSVDDNLQKKINESVGKTLILNKGIHKSYILRIPSNIKIIIPKNATIKLADDCIIDQSKYGEAEGDAVIKINGTENNFLENIFIELNGTIDGNKSNHTYKAGGIEGINLKWVKNSYIYGEASVINANGDGLDIDVSNNCYIEGINFLNNDGGGVHFGSPRPIKSSFNNLVLGCSAKFNGFLHQRSGFDQSWPNINAVTYIDCESKSNFQNWNIKGSGGVILNSASNDLSAKILDFFGDAFLYNSAFEDKNEFKINQTGYYLFSFKNNLSESEKNPTINGKEINDIRIISKNRNEKISTAIYLLYKNDIIAYNVENENEPNVQFKSNKSMKLDLILLLNDIYPKDYNFKIFSWRVKSEINKFIYMIYSFVFD